MKADLIEHAADVAPFEVLGDRYRIGPVLGRGGASVVYRAHDAVLERDVAVKVFLTDADDPDDFAAQQEEARVLAGLNHPGVVTLLDTGVHVTASGAPQVFLVMELVSDTDLRHRLRKGALEPQETASLGRDLADALRFVHEHGIIHRDVKPANVLLVDAGPDRPARGKLADFGIAIPLTRAITTEESATGTAAYLSPEQVEGDPLDEATDVYSLGLVILEALTGRTAYPGPVIESALSRLDHDPFIPATTPEHLATLLRAMTARCPADRPTAAEAATEFRRIVFGDLDPRPTRAASPGRTPDPHDDLIDTARRSGGTSRATRAFRLPSFRRARAPRHLET